MYAEGLPAEVRLKALTRGGRLPFAFEASGSRRTSPTASPLTAGASHLRRPPTRDPGPPAARRRGRPRSADMARQVRRNAACYRLGERPQPLVVGRSIRSGQVEVILAPGDSMSMDRRSAGPYPCDP